MEYASYGITKDVQTPHNETRRQLATLNGWTHAIVRNRLRMRVVQADVADAVLVPSNGDRIACAETAWSADMDAF